MVDWGNLLQAILQLIQTLDRLTGFLWPLTHALEPLAVVVRDGVGLVLSLWFDFVLRTKDAETGGDFVQSAVIKTVEPAVQLFADSMLGLVVIWSSYRIMWAQGARSQLNARVLLPRLFLGVVLINFSQPLIQAAVDASNTLSGVVVKLDTVADWATWWHTFAVNPQDSVLEVITTMVLVLGYDVLAITYVVRYTVLILLAITAPLAGLLLVLPETAHLAKMWRKLFVVNLLMQPVQLFVMAIGFALENTGHNPLRHAFAVAALLVMLKVPGAMGSAEKVAHRLESEISHSIAHVAHGLVRVA